MAKLTDEQRLTKLEATITEGLKSFVAVGSALETIQTEELYKVTHGTWELYTQVKWDMTKQYAGRLIAASKCVRDLTDRRAAGETIVSLPATETQAKELLRVPAEQRGSVMNAAAEVAQANKRCIFANDIKAAADKALGKKQPAAEQDGTDEEQDAGTAGKTNKAKDAVPTTPTVTMEMVFAFIDNASLGDVLQMTSRLGARHMFWMNKAEALVDVQVSDDPAPAIVEQINTPTKKGKKQLTAAA